MQNVHFSTTEISELFGVNVSTVKRWIDRGLLESSVTPGGHRRVTRSQLEKFIRNNKKIGSRSYVIKRLAKTSPNPQAAWKKLYTELLQNDIAGARKVLREYYLSHASITYLLECVLTPVLRHIGSEWEKKRISIYQEHQMSFLIRLFLVEISGIIPEPRKNAPRAILACVEGDRHEIPLQMLSLILKMHGIQSVILGTNIPLTEIIRSSKDNNAQYLLLTRIFSRTKSFNYLQTIARYASMNHITLLYGGSGWSTREKKLFHDPEIIYTDSLRQFDNFLVRRD